MLELKERGIDFGELTEAMGQPDADPLDPLCHLAFDTPLRTRRERADYLRKNRPDFFDRYGSHPGGRGSRRRRCHANKARSHLALPRDRWRLQSGRQTSAPTGRNPYSPGQRPGRIKTHIQRALKGRHNLWFPGSQALLGNERNLRAIRPNRPGFAKTRSGFAGTRSESVKTGYAFSLVGWAKAPFGAFVVAAELSGAVPILPATSHELSGCCVGVRSLPPNLRAARRIPSIRWAGSGGCCWLFPDRHIPPFQG
uniref:Uncharacterized protein n=1 Tax=Candidatus Kentrum sp. DK TaxID=2126562 RepID=A0A450TQS7_9GAMM|nr:MAG: hypothetical protein BECKDK2373B_GA0170837_12832 [Candidatus Kentron sp. DK]